MPRYIVKDDKGKKLSDVIVSGPRDAVVKLLLPNEKILRGVYDEDSGKFGTGKYKEVQRSFIVERIYV